MSVPETIGRPMVLPRGPLVAAAGRSVPALVVGEAGEDDLRLARTLLAAILAAAPPSAAGLDWAVAVFRTSKGALVMVNTAEGRGWLPPGLFLPMAVTTVWRWPVIARQPGDELIAPLEGVADPARALAEFGLLGMRTGRGRISALVSSAHIPHTVRAGLGNEVLIEDGAEAVPSAIDLSSPAAGLVDRLAVAGLEKLQVRADTAEKSGRATCLELARDAETRIRSLVADADGDSSGYHELRRRILDALHAGEQVPERWWGQLRDADAMLAAVTRGRRMDVSDSPLGVRVDPPGADALRTLVFERRVGELSLLLAAGEPSAQTLRDALYTYGQIVEHPLLRGVPGVDGLVRTGVSDG